MNAIQQWPVTLSAVCAGSIACAACTRDAAPDFPDLVATAPVLEYCMHDAARLLSEIRDLPYSGRLVEFTSPVRTHPDLWGFVELRVNGDQAPEFERLANAVELTAADNLAAIASGVITNCKVNSELEFSKSNPNQGSQLFDFLAGVDRNTATFERSDGTTGRIDSYSVSIVDEEELVRVFFNVQ